MSTAIAIGTRYHDEIEAFLKSAHIYLKTEVDMPTAEREKRDVAAKRAECEGRVSGFGRRKKRKK